MADALRVKRTIRSGIGLMLLLAGTGCSSVDDQRAGNESRTTELKVVVSNEPVTMNPVLAGVTDGRVWTSMMEPLIRSDESGVLLDSGLTTSWEQVTPTTWDFNLRSNVKFHNGEAFDATAAAFAIEQSANDPKSKLAGYLQVIADVEVRSDDSISITTSEPYVALPQVLSVVYAIPPKYYQETGPQGFAQAPIGTGPFKLALLDAGSEIAVERNDSYWGESPRVDRISFTYAPDPASRLALLQGGSIDVAVEVPVAQLGEIENDSDIQLSSSPTIAMTSMFFETTKPPFDDERIRRAAALAIDRDALVETLYDGKGATAQAHMIGQFLSTLPRHESAVSYDPDAAKALLAGAHPETSLTFATGQYPEDVKVAEALAGMLEAVGFNVKRNPVDLSTFYQLRSAKSMPMYIHKFSAVFLHPDMYVNGFFTSDSITKHCVNANIDAMSTQALSAPPEESEEVYAALEDQVLNQMVCNVPLFELTGLYGVSSHVSGFKAPGNQLPNWAAVGKD